MRIRKHMVVRHQPNRSSGWQQNFHDIEEIWPRSQFTKIRAPNRSRSKTPLLEPPPLSDRFGSALVLSRVDWVRPEMVVEVSFARMGLGRVLRHIAYLGEREEKPARDMIHGDLDPIVTGYDGMVPRVFRYLY